MRRGAGWRAATLVGLLGLAGATLAGCAAVRREGEGWIVPRKGYRVAAPAGWARMPGEADLVFGQPTLAAGLMAQGTCGGKTPTRPLGVLARHLRFGLKEVAGLEETPMAVASQPGVQSRFTARLDGVAVAVRAVTLRGARCVYDLVVVAPPERLPVVEPDFERFVGSFALLEATP